MCIIIGLSVYLNFFLLFSLKSIAQWTIIVYATPLYYI